MCGIAGFVDFQHQGDTHILAAMGDSLIHRGPDDDGQWLGCVGQAQVGLAHRRLSIIDPRPESAQPMEYSGLRVVYNGEIYNYAEIRAELKGRGHNFKTVSDTEVLLHAFSEWGPECVHRFIGMFAFLVVDENRRTVYLVRDRAGVKPLYVYRSPERLVFASELRALRQYPGFRPELDAVAFSRFFDYGYVPSGRSIYRDVVKLMPGTMQCVDLDSGETRIERYWSLDDSFRNDRLHLDYQGASDRLADLLRSASRYRMVSDVPVGVFLSGGYDSTAVLASLRASADAPIKAFTIGFETGNNELPQARRIAAALGCEHFEYICTEADAREIIPGLPEIYDEPFADSSAIPTVLVARFAAQHVKVALSADGGDELFLGYDSYAVLGRRLARLGRLPRPMRRWLAAALQSAAAVVPKARVQRRHLLRGLSLALDEDNAIMARRLHILARQLPQDYRNRLFVGFREASCEDAMLAVNAFDPLDEAASWDYGHYLVDDILVKVDRATMSTSLEGREPLLDHRLAEFAARLPRSYRYDGSVRKRILRDYVHTHVPREIMDGPKRGFSVPVLPWLRGELVGLLDEYLSEDALRASGLFRPAAIVPLVQNFRAGRLHYSPLIWKLLMFQMWYRRWMIEA